MAGSSIVADPSDKVSGSTVVEEEEAPRGLPRPLFLAILGAVVALFLIARGPVWRDPWNIDVLDSAIFWSYVPIPFLVAGGLLLARRFSWRFVFLESLAITLIKYTVTFSIAMVLWTVKSPPPRPSHAAPPPRAVAETAPPPPTPIAPERTGALRGVVTDAAGKPVPGAFVYVAAGLEAVVFERPSEPVRVENDGASIHVAGEARAPKGQASLVVARAGQTILGRSLDGHLHTLVASGAASGTTFNIPMMSSGAWSEVVVVEPAKVSRLECTVHPGGEAPAYLVVLDHPFSTRTAPDGSFRMEGIPAGKISVAAWHATLGGASADVTVAAREGAALDLRIAGPGD